MFVKGVDGSAKTDYTMDVSIVQEASAAVLGKVAADTGGLLLISKLNWCDGLQCHNSRCK